MASSENESIAGGEGLVKWFDPRKGFGFIVGPDGQDIFVHYSVIQGDGFRVLNDNTHVEYDAENSEKGWRATRVIKPAVAEVIASEEKPGFARAPQTH